MTDQAAAPTHDIIIVGGGPRAISLLERITARAPHRTLDVVMIDRFEIGAGATWRTDQTPHFLNNTYSAHTTIYPDASTPMTGPVTSGPDLVDWARDVAGGAEQETVDTSATWAPPPREAWVAREARQVLPWSYPTRRLQGVYYREQLAAILARGQVDLETARGTATSLEARGDLRTITLEDGRAFTAPHVVLAQGMVQALPDEGVQHFRAHALARGLTYISPGMPSERDWSVLAEGEPVLTAGLGANFFDIITLLTQGRGGQFVPRGGPFDLEYHPSGREPRFIAGSRRGLPYRSKSHYGALPPAYEAQLASDEWFTTIGRGQGLDFARDVWPQFLREFTLAHLATLAVHHPHAVPSVTVTDRPQGWADPATAPLSPAVLEGIQATPVYRLAALIADLVVDEERRFDPERLDRPDPRPGETWEAWVERWVREERESITTPFTSPRASVNRAMARLRGRLGRISRAIDPVSRHRDLQGWFGRISLTLASGPPPERTARLLALVEAGVVELLGPGSRFETTDHGFGARSEVRDRVEVSALIETRMSKGTVDRTDDPLIRSLKTRGAARLHTRTSADGHRVTTRTLDVTSEDFALIDARGASDAQVQVLGIPAGDVQPGSAIGATPGVPSPLIAGADLVAETILASLHTRGLVSAGV